MSVVATRAVTISAFIALATVATAIVGDITFEGRAFAQASKTLVRAAGSGAFALGKASANAIEIAIERALEKDAKPLASKTPIVTFEVLPGNVKFNWSATWGEVNFVGGEVKNIYKKAGVSGISALAICVLWFDTLNYKECIKAAKSINDREARE